MSNQPQLTPVQLQELAAAQEATRKIRRAVSVALFDGWSVGIFAGLTFLVGLLTLPDLTGIVMGLAMGMVAVIELRGASALRRLDTSAPRRLGFNQLALGGILFIYGAWGLGRTLMYGAGSEAIESVKGQLGEMGKSMESLEQAITVLIYSTVIAVAIIVQGGTALFYFRRAKYIQHYVSQTPQWILQMQRAGVGL